MADVNFTSLVTSLITCHHCVSFTVALVICKLRRVYVTSGAASVYFDDADNATCKSRVGLPYSVLPVAELTIFGFGCERMMNCMVVLHAYIEYMRAIQPCNTHLYCIVVTSWHCVLHHKLAIKNKVLQKVELPKINADDVNARYVKSISLPGSGTRRWR